MATIINPITTVLLNREEFESGEFERFPFKYILEKDGTISYFSKLSAGRYIRSHEACIPGLGVNKAVKAPTAEIQPLAEGFKIPGDMFFQVKQFFLDVMDLGPSTYEAQIFIVWSKANRDYRIVVPKQRVSAAAVRYDIGDLLTDDDVIICDIHSHNNMGAFFSGTDNNDDKKNPWISGVFGKLSTTMENKFRFNDGGGRHFPMEASDVFDFGTSFQTPQSWLDQVEIATYAPVKSHFGHQQPRTWEESLDFPVSSQKQGTSKWTAPNQGDVGGYNWMDELADEEGDIYDGIVDDLMDLSHDEARNVLIALEKFISNPQHVSELSVREADAFVSASYSVIAAKNDTLASNAISSLLIAYN